MKYEMLKTASGNGKLYLLKFAYKPVLGLLKSGIPAYLLI